MIKILDTKYKSFKKDFSFYLNLRKNYSVSKSFLVRKVVHDIKKNKDKSLLKYEKKFNKLNRLVKKEIFYSESEIKKIISSLSPEVKNSIDLAYRRIVNFHKKQKFNNFKVNDKFNNNLSYRCSPLEKVGVYVPGGKASYPSSVLMNCIPGIIAGVKEIYMTVPSLKKEVDPGVIYAAKKCKVKRIYRIGGAQAIAAFAYGTESVPKVDKIFGPGNEYVILAKKEVFGEVGIDMIAGPSEVTIIADKFSNPEWVSADLIAQAEHDELAQSILVSNDKNLILKTVYLLKKQLKKLPKKKIATESLKNFGLAILAKNVNEISDIVNIIAPEHLEIFTRKPNIYLKKIKNAGSIFLGPYSPEAMGDYLAGPNHVLPTSGTAKFSSGLSVYDFLKRQSVVKITKSGIERLGPSVINLAKHEKLYGHAESVQIRIKKG